MRICVVSDVHYKFCHLSGDEKLRHEKILRFFRSLVGQYDLLVLNGDIFDLWSESSFTITKQYFPLLKVLADIQEASCRLVYISGNHDFWFGDFFRDYLGAEIYDKSYSLTADEQKILFSHGDLFTFNDLRYKIFRQIIRTRPVRWVYNLLHPDLALRLGASLSRSSSFKRLSTLRHRRRSAGLEHYAASKIKSGQYDLVIMGHSHEPVKKPIGKGFYLNRGDWIRSFTYVKVVDGYCQICCFESE